MIWLIGANGLLGRHLHERLLLEGRSFVATDHSTDITEREKVTNFVLQHPDIDWIVNCAGYTEVDKAEDDESSAYQVNAYGAENCSHGAASIGARLIYFSTDYVFDGKSKRPYKETDRVGPLCVYARSKVEGEERTKAACPNSLIFRSSWIYGKIRPNFVQKMISLMNSMSSVRVVSDQKGTPTFAGDLADFVLHVIDSNTVQFGTYHYTNLGETTWFDFATEIKALGEKMGIIRGNCKISPCKSDEYKTKAVRPHYSVLSKEKVLSSFGIQIPTWQESLERFMRTMNSVAS